MVAADALGPPRDRGGPTPAPPTRCWLGLAQAAALVPGVSRSGRDARRRAGARVRARGRVALSREVALPVLLGASRAEGRWRLRGGVRGRAAARAGGRPARPFASTLAAAGAIGRGAAAAAVAVGGVPRRPAPRSSSRVRQNRGAMTRRLRRAGVDTGAADARDRRAGRRAADDRAPAGRRASSRCPATTPPCSRSHPDLGIAVGTDGVGSKLIVAERTGRYDTVGIDCIAMNVNDVICVGAEPIAVLDYLAVEQTDPDVFAAIARGLKAGAEQAGVEIPGGEVAVLPELIRGHPSPTGFDLTAACFGTVALDAIVTGAACAPGDALIGLPSSGLHSNGYTLARRVLEPLGLDARPDALGGASVADVLLEPTVIYVRAVLELLRSDLPVHGLAHITGGGLANLLRLSDRVGFAIEAPLPLPPVYALLRGSVPEAEMWSVFNMGCGFVAVVPEAAADDAVALLAAHHPGTARVGTVTAEAGAVGVPPLGVTL